MDAKQAGLVLVLRECGVSLDLSTFERRLIIQKSVYLSQAAKVDLGYYFRWYLKGPYCSELTRDAYAVRLEGDTDASRWELVSDDVNRLRPVRSWAAFGKSDADRARHLEVLASVHFVRTRPGFSAKNAEDVTEALRRLEKDVGVDEVETAITELATHGIIPREFPPSNRS